MRAQQGLPVQAPHGLALDFARPEKMVNQQAYGRHQAQRHNPCQRSGWCAALQDDAYGQIDASNQPYPAQRTTPVQTQVAPDGNFN